MSKSQAFLYTLATCGIYLCVFLLELLLVKPLVAGFELNFVINILISLLLIIVINPLISYFLVNKLPFKPKGLRSNTKHNVNWHTYE